EDSTLFVCCCWSLWTGRNARQHGRPAWSPYAAARYIAKMMEDLLIIHEKPIQTTRIRTPWKKPEPGPIKINTDAAFHITEGNGATVRDGLSLARRCGVRQAVVESDSSVAIQLLRSPKGERSMVAGIWHDVQELANSFESLVFVHVRREANEAAHVCAKAAYSTMGVCEWLDHTPNFLVDVVARDCNQLIV
ncbi:unnamed protein product, partial [Urochloa humidicola]